MLVAPSVANHVALGHLPEQVGTAARGMFFFASRAKARTHYSACVLAAFAYSHATQCSVRQAAMVFGKLEVGLRLPRFVVGAQAQILIQLIWLDYFARIHLPIRDPRAL